MVKRFEDEWTAWSEYPQATMPGIGLMQFAAALSDDDESAAIALRCRFSCESNATKILDEVARGAIQVGDLYAGALSRLDPVFQLGSLPFAAARPAASLQLLAVARAAYQAKFDELGVRLLYVSPWPPTGLWCSAPIRTLADLARMRIRTYDEMSSEVFRSAGAQACDLPISQALAQLAVGSLNAMLSSGDGAAGERFRAYLPYFYDLQYAAPISFVVIHAATYKALAGDRQRTIDEAARCTERQLWRDVHVRINDNRARMIAARVHVEPHVSAVVRGALQSGGRAVCDRWEARAPRHVCALLSDCYPSAEGR